MEMKRELIAYSLNFICLPKYLGFNYFVCSNGKGRRRSGNKNFEGVTEEDVNKEWKIKTEIEEFGEFEMTINCESVKTGFFGHALVNGGRWNILGTPFIEKGDKHSYSYHILLNLFSLVSLSLFQVCTISCFNTTLFDSSLLLLCRVKPNKKKLVGHCMYWSKEVCAPLLLFSQNPFNSAFLKKSLFQVSSLSKGIQNDKNSFPQFTSVFVKKQVGKFEKKKLNLWKRQREELVLYFPTLKKRKSSSLWKQVKQVG